MRTMMLVVGLFWSGFTVADANKDDSWVIIDARVFPSHLKQPTFIAVGPISRRAEGEGQHLPTGQTMVPLTPGTYSIGHVDFGDSELSDYDTIPMNRRKFGQFEVVPGAITFVGIIEIRSTQKEKVDGIWEISIEGTTEPLAWACEKDPETMARLPLRLKQKDGSYALRKISCNAAD